MINFDELFTILPFVKKGFKNSDFPILIRYESADCYGSEESSGLIHSIEELKHFALQKLMIVNDHIEPFEACSFEDFFKEYSEGLALEEYRLIKSNLEKSTWEHITYKSSRLQDLESFCQSNWKRYCSAVEISNTVRQHIQEAVETENADMAYRLIFDHLAYECLIERYFHQYSIDTGISDLLDSD